MSVGTKKVLLMSIGSFSLVKNESYWIGPHLSRTLPYLDQAVFFDGGSEDGTLEIIEALGAEYPGKVKLYRDKDPKDLQDDYVRLFNECLHSLDTDLAAFLHPDMFIVNPQQLLKIRDSQAIALTAKMRTFAGDPDGQLYEIVGRGEAWKNLYRLRNPDLGAHYYGHYGAHEEDVYFSAITGGEHANYAPLFGLYPYEVEDSGLEILHFSDVRPYARRLDRMRKCLINQMKPAHKVEAAAEHPRVTLKDGMDLTFKPCEYPAEFLAAQNKYRHLQKEPASV